MVSDKNSRGLAILAVGAALIALFVAAGLMGAFGSGVPQELWASAGALSGALVGVLVPSPKTPATPSAAAAVTVVNSAALQAAQTLGRAIVTDDATKEAAVASALDAVRHSTAELPSGTKGTAVSAAVAQHMSTAADSTDAVSRQVTKAAADAAAESLPTALNQSVATGQALPAWASWVASALWQILKPLALALITYIALRTGIRISDGAISYSHGCPVTTAVPAKTSAAPCVTALFQAGTALITLGAAAGGALVGLFAPPSTSSPGSSGGK